MSTDCGEYGCCPGINIDCDNAIRKSLTNGNNHVKQSYIFKS